MTEQPTPSTAKRARAMIVLGAVAAVVTGIAIYGIGAMQRNPADAACRPSTELAKRLAPLARGEVAAINIAAEPKRLPDLAFTDAAGKARTLADFRGRTVLLNLWATWCVPCRKEMPALDALQGKLGGDKFEVVAVNIDTRNLDKPKTWLAEVGVTRLGYFADPSAKVFQDLKAVGKAIGMPTTLLIDPQGCELGVLAGPAEWASDDAIRLIEAASGSAS
jgi:thiol-disulfide isomerase/thioredoxin